jgi:quaternary ammonium compound-resistance protein SugE
MAWIILLLAGLLEIVWALGLKYTQGFTRLLPSLVTVAALIGSILLLARAARTLPIGTAYAVWVGVGALGAAIGGVMLFGEAVTLKRLGFLALLLIALIGLKLTAGGAESGTHPQPSQSAAETTLRPG